MHTDIAPFIEEFEHDWLIAGWSSATSDTYCLHLRKFSEFCVGPPTLREAKRWLATAQSSQSARSRARALRAFGKWSERNEGPDFTWWADVPLANVKLTAQRTVTRSDYERVKGSTQSIRDRLVVEMLWCTGCRLGELARLKFTDVSLTNRSIVVRLSKTGEPRLAPLSDGACRLIRRLPPERRQEGEPLLGMTTSAIQQLMRRLDAPSPHAWRRGWAVESLRSGISETSVRAAAGWSSGAMVARYTAAASAELAIHEFRSIAGES